MFLTNSCNVGIIDLASDALERCDPGKNIVWATAQFYVVGSQSIRNDRPGLSGSNTNYN